MLVLVVEDEALIRMLVCDLLEDAGFRCLAAPHAEAALAMIEAGGCRPDLLVTDFNLGPGMDGIALAREALRHLPGLPVAYVTGNPECFAAHALGARERLLAKPFREEELLDAVRALATPAWLHAGFPGAGVQAAAVAAGAGALGLC